MTVTDGTRASTPDHSGAGSAQYGVPQSGSSRFSLQSGRPPRQWKQDTLVSPSIRKGLLRAENNGSEHLALAWPLLEASESRNSPSGQQDGNPRH
uniref:Uncharacterized protein n=1 Tax=Streptomyces avermitilis TaxID=33903 RepID=A0A499W9T8_STRAX|nr:hypothetical protein SAVMC3_89660 [Streptomyces avermitilis]